MVVFRTMWLVLQIQSGSRACMTAVEGVHCIQGLGQLLAVGCGVSTARCKRCPREATEAPACAVLSAAKRNGTAKRCMRCCAGVEHTQSLSPRLQVCVQCAPPPRKLTKDSEQLQSGSLLRLRCTPRPTCESRLENRVARSCLGTAAAGARDTGSIYLTPDNT